MASSGVYRNPPISAKEVHYHSDGTGRDKYIWWTNGGGFKNEPEYSKGFEIGTFGEKPKFKPINNYKPAKPIHYAPDGTGRDTYVITDEGGLAQGHQRINFINSLRGYSTQSREIKKNDFFTQTQFKPKNINKSQLYEQKNLISRLASPKKVEDPYQEIRTKTILPGLRKIY